MKDVSLIFVSAAANHNKFYEMHDLGDGTFEVRYGRVGTRGSFVSYPISKWETKYKEKICKGYRDVSEYRKAEVRHDTDIENLEVKDLIDRLLDASEKFISKNYLGDTVSLQQINDVQELISYMKHTVLRGDLKSWDKIRYFNGYVEMILSIIPRVTMNVNSLLAETEKDFDRVLEREQSLLNVLSAKVKAERASVSGRKLLDGIEIAPVTAEEEKDILSHLDRSTRGRYVRAFRITNNETEENFNKFVKDNGYTENDIHFNYHGSRNRNWIGIIRQGLKLNPKAPITGKMFGYGIYSATSSAKSMNYASLSDCYWNGENEETGYLAVFKVAMKNPHHIYKHSAEHSRFDQTDMDRLGTDGVFAHKGQSLRADEIVVYREEQMTIRYLIEIR